MVRNVSALPGSNGPLETPVAPRAALRWRSPHQQDRSWVYHSLALIATSILPVVLLSLLLAFTQQSNPALEASNAPEKITDPTVAAGSAPVTPTSPAPGSLSPKVAEAQPVESPVELLRPIQAQPMSVRPKAFIPTSTRLAVRVSTTTPQRARGFWVTVIVPQAERKTTAQPTVRFQDAKGHRYFLTLKPNGRPGEWTRRFGLDQAGTWRGVAILQQGKRKLSVPLPVLRVLP